MSRYRFALAVLFATVAAGVAPGQTKEIQDQIDLKLASARAAGRTEEHVEIFRRLLERGLSRLSTHSAGAAQFCPALNGSPNLNSLADPPALKIEPGFPGGVRGVIDYGSPMMGTGGAYNPTLKDSPVGMGGALTYRNLLFSGTGHYFDPVTAVEGVYLKGHGVLFTVTLPFAAQKPQATSEPPAEKPLSPWEREQRALRGEKAEPTRKTETAPPSVSETVLRLLAENGQHFSELKPNESVTIAVVYRPSRLTIQQCAQCHQNLGGSTPGNKVPKPLFQQSASGAGPGTPPPANQAWDSLLDSFKNGRALAELHLKQGKPREAAQAYRKLLEQCAEMLAALEKLPSESSHERLQLIVLDRELHVKLAQALLAAGDNESAAKVFEGNPKYKDVTSYSGLPKATAPTPLPTKLIISATKSVLDQVGSGKLSFEEFRKAASVEFVGAESGAKP